MDNYQTVEIVFLAMLAGFIALRLYSVLGRRTGHQGEPAGDIVAKREMPKPQTGGAGVVEAPAWRELNLPQGLSADLRSALQRIADADPRFDPGGFAKGARAAYAMILEAFWKGDIEALKPLVSDEILDQFTRAINQRTSDGQVLDNRLVDLREATLVDAQLEGAMAEITVRFDAVMMAVTRTADGQLVSGTPDQPIEAHDLWTFSRHLRSADPNWLLIASDAEG